jgi:hypothetical protein
MSIRDQMKYFPTQSNDARFSATIPQLHPDLIESPARLIAEASERSDVWVTTHSQALVQAIGDQSGVDPIVLRLENCETVITESPDL